MKNDKDSLIMKKNLLENLERWLEDHGWISSLILEESVLWKIALPPWEVGTSLGYLPFLLGKAWQWLFFFLKFGLLRYFKNKLFICHWRYF